MTLEDLGNIGDFLGGIGVVITLLYLAIQIRQNTRQLKADSMSAQTIALENGVSDVARWIAEIVENRDLAELWGRGLTDVEQLDPTDRLRFDYLGIQLLQAWQTMYRRSVQANDPELWEVTLRYIKMYFRSPGFQALWADSRSLLVSEFVTAVEKVFPESESHLTNQSSEDAATGTSA